MILTPGVGRAAVAAEVRPVLVHRFRSTSNLEADGGVSQVVGLFPSHDAALSALRSKGKYTEL